MGEDAGVADDEVDFRDRQCGQGGAAFGGPDVDACRGSLLHHVNLILIANLNPFLRSCLS